MTGQSRGRQDGHRGSGESSTMTGTLVKSTRLNANSRLTGSAGAPVIRLIAACAAKCPASPAAVALAACTPTTPGSRSTCPGLRRALFAACRQSEHGPVPGWYMPTLTSGVRLVSSQHLRDMAAVTYEGTDEVMGVRATWTFGYSPYRPSGAPSRPGSIFGMVGSNGSAAYADIDAGAAVALMRNRYSPDLSAITEVDRIVVDSFPTAATNTRGSE